MKKQILKIAGVKSEKEFYKKYPTEEAFMKEHGKAFKKAQIGAYITSEAAPTTYQPADVRGMYDEIDYQLTGMTSADRARMEAIKQAASELAQSVGGEGGGMDMGQMAQFAEMAGAKKGKKIPNAQGGRVQTGGLPRTQLGDVRGTGMQTGGLPRTQLGNVTDRGPMPVPSAIPTATVTPKKKFNPADGIPVLGQVIGGIQNIKEQKKRYKGAQQQTALTDVMAQASASAPVQEPRRRYVRPEDMAFQPEELSRSYGVGTNPFGQAEFGASVGGGEIMNTYAPGTLYDNLGYEPLDDSSRLKQFQGGGQLMSFLGSSEGKQLADIMGGGQTGGYSEVLGGAGEIAGGPVPFMTRFIGSAIDRTQEKKIENQQRLAQENIIRMVGQNFGRGVQSQFGNFMEDGGTTSPYAWMSHTWQPQVIASFGGHNLKDLLKPPHDADMLRAGGHLKEYTPPSAAAMSTERPAFEDGGDLQVHRGGKAEIVSFNRHLPNGGPSIRFKGNSHEEGGIDITYGNNPVEVEEEPAQILKNGGTGESSLNVYGNLVVSDWFLPLFQTGPKKVQIKKGEKYKKYVDRLNDVEAKQNKLIDKSADAIDNMGDVLTPIDQITANSYHMNMLGANEVERDIANKKVTLASAQSSINDTAKEKGVVADDLAKGRIKVDKDAMKDAAKFGKMIDSAQGGTKKLKTLEARPDVPSQTKTGKYYGTVTDAKVQRMMKNNPWYDWSNFDPENEADIEDFQIAFNEKAKEQGVPVSLRVDGQLGEQTVSAKGVYEGEPAKPAIPTVKDELVPILPTTEPYTQPTAPASRQFQVVPQKRSQLLDVIGQVLPYVVRPNQEQLDPRQLIGEMYALATNQLEPVQAQTMQPLLSTPQDISLQDILNQNQADYNAAQRLTGYNPAALANLNAQKYQANQRVLGEQFRLNQAERQRVYEQNRNLLNEFGLKNLAILDRQYERQERAKSITKGVNLEAFKSIGDKFMRNQLENRNLATFQNMFGYRFDPRFRARNVNAPVQFQMPVVYTGGESFPVLDRMGNPITIQNNPAPINKTVPIPIPQSSSQTIAPTVIDEVMPDNYGQMLTPDEIKEMYRTSGKNGAKVGKKKGLNGSIVKAFKNL